jgi:hypothetical protein
VAAQNDRASGPIFGAQIPQPRQTFSIFKGKQPLTAYFIWWCRSLALALDQLAVPGDANWNRATKHVSLWRHEHRRLALFGCCILFYCRDQRGDWRHLADHGARGNILKFTFGLKKNGVPYFLAESEAKQSDPRKDETTLR